MTRNQKTARQASQKKLIKLPHILRKFLSRRMPLILVRDKVKHFEVRGSSSFRQWAKYTGDSVSQTIDALNFLALECQTVRRHGLGLDPNENEDLI